MLELLKNTEDYKRKIVINTCGELLGSSALNL